MAGYNWNAGKSNNAVRAEGDGKLVASKFAAWVKQWRRFAGCTAQDVAEAMTAAEWHHSSKFFNRVNYFDTADMLQSDVREELAATISRRKAFERLLKQHGSDGWFVIKTPDGDEWYKVNKSDRYNATALERMQATIAMVA